MKIFFRGLLLALFLITPLSALSIYEDVTAETSAIEVINNKAKFENTEKNAYIYTDSTIWLKFDFSHHKKKESEKYILFNFATLNHVDMYYKTQGGLQEFTGGAATEKEFPFNEIVFTLPLDEIDDKIVYFKIKHNGVMSLENKIFDSKGELFKLLILRSDITTIMVVVAVLMMIFTAILAYYLKEWLYKFYFLFVLSSTIMLLVINNSLTWIFGVSNISLLVQLTVDITAITAYLFIMNLTKMSDTFPKIYKFFKIITTITIYLMVAEFFKIKEMGYIKNIYIVPLFLTLIYLSLFYMFYKGAKYSKFISTALLFLLASLLTMFLTITGVVTGMYNPVIWKLFIILEMITFSFMLLYIIKKLSDNKMQQELVLEEQSKLAVIGETLTNIEHQWRSPLAKISSNIIALETELEIKGSISHYKLQKSLDSMSSTLDYMTNLVDYFKVFYMKDQEKKPFLVGNAYLRVSRLLEYDFLKYGIKLTYIDEDKVQILGHLNEFTQVILNILSNSRDIFVERHIVNPKIDIIVKKQNKKVLISIEDNAGGIEEEKLNEVFNQFFSGKQDKSSGVGLYLCKHIVEKKMDGTIRVKNTNDGVKFTIKL